MVGSGAARRANVRIRPAEPADARVLAELLLPLEPAVPTGGPAGRRAEAGPDVEAAAAHLTATLARPDRHVLVALDTSRAAAGADAATPGDPADGGDAVAAAPGPVVGVVVAHLDDAGLIVPMPVLAVTRLAVSPDLRRRGIGRALLSACVDLAEAHGVHHLTSASPPAARDANRYLARVGFAPMATRRMAPLGVVRKSLGLPAHGVPDAEVRLARRRLGRLPGRAVRPAARVADGQPAAHPGA